MNEDEDTISLSTQHSAFAVEDRVSGGGYAIMNSAVLLLDNAAKEHGRGVALKDEAGEITYADLRDSSRRVGTALLSRLPNESYSVSPVLLLMKKSINAVIAMMGVLYSGNPYVPLDYDIPEGRLRGVIAEIEPRCIIVDEDIKPLLDGWNPCEIEILIISDLVKTQPDEAMLHHAVSRVKDSDPVYIMYTSGSTGAPKGVVIPHRGIIYYAQWAKNTFGFSSDTVIGSQIPFAFDSIAMGIFGAICASARLILIPDILFRFPEKLIGYINENGVTTLHFVPTIMKMVANSGTLSNENMPNLKQVLFGGEVMPNKHLNVWRKSLPDVEYINFYGPTEASVDCTYYIVDRPFGDSDPLPIGKAKINVGVIILTEEDETAQNGEVGELCILGSGVGLGYWGNMEATRKVFVQNPLIKHFEDRMYRTGDLAYMDDEGLIYFAGRKDSQIKLNGYRIELGEIDTALSSISGIENSCAMFDPERGEIIAFIQSQSSFTLPRLRKLLLEKIPRYMLPARLEVMEALPLTANGKIDRIALREGLG